MALAPATWQRDSLCTGSCSRGLGFRLSLTCMRCCPHASCSDTIGTSESCICMHPRQHPDSALLAGANTSRTRTICSWSSRVHGSHQLCNCPKKPPASFPAVFCCLCGFSCLASSSSGCCCCCSSCFPDSAAAAWSFEVSSAALRLAADLLLRFLEGVASADVSGAFVLPLVVDLCSC
jgi:hypothetical protein